MVFSIDHDLPSSLAENCYKASEKFFNLDLELKLKYHHKNLKGARGYTPNGIETAVGEMSQIKKNFGIMDQLLMKHMISAFQKIYSLKN